MTTAFRGYCTNAVHPLASYPSFNLKLGQGAFTLLHMERAALGIINLLLWAEPKTLVCRLDVGGLYST
jgi:hypothetical protein